MSSEAENTNSNDNDQYRAAAEPIIQEDASDAQQEDFSEPLDPAEAIIGEPVIPEPEPAEAAPSSTTEQPAPVPQLPSPPAETPSTSNNALIMQIKILSKYPEDIKRSMAIC